MDPTSSPRCETAGPEGASDERSRPAPLSLKRNIAWNTTGCLFYQGCQWLTTIVVVWLSHGYDNAGILALAMAVGNIFASIALYKMRTFQVSDVANAYSQGNYAAVRFITVGAAFALCIPYALLTTTGTDTVLCILAFLLFKSDEAFADLLYGVDQRGMRMDYIGISQLLRGVASLGAFSLGLLVGHNLLAAIGTMFVSCLAITLFYDLPHAQRFASLRPRIYGRTALSLLRSGLPAVLALVANIAVVSVSRQFLGALCGEELLGIYASISTPAVLMQAAVGYLYTPMIGHLSQLWNSHDVHGLIRFLGKMGVLVIGSLALCSALLVAVAPWLLTLVFGESIAPWAWIFPSSMLCTALIALISLACDVLIVFRRPSSALLSCAAAFLVAVVAAVPFIEAFSLNGINLSISLAYGLGIVIATIAIVSAIRRRCMMKTASQNS